MSRAAQRARLVTEIAGRGKYPAIPTGHREPKQQAGWPSLAGSIILIFIMFLKAVQQHNGSFDRGSYDSRNWPISNVLLYHSDISKYEILVCFKTF